MAAVGCYYELMLTVSEGYQCGIRTTADDVVCTARRLWGLSEALRERWNELTEKTYLARVEGELAEERGVFESYLLEDADGYKVRSVQPSSVSRLKSKVLRQPKIARTEWRKLSVEDGTTLVEVTLKSGRKNQIRVHFSEAGHPVVGDVKYGGQKASRLYLHSEKLKFKHPHTGRWMSFESVPSTKH